MRESVRKRENWDRRSKWEKREWVGTVRDFYGEGKVFLQEEHWDWYPLKKKSFEKRCMVWERERERGE